MKLERFNVIDRENNSDNGKYVTYDDAIKFALEFAAYYSKVNYVYPKEQALINFLGKD